MEKLDFDCTAKFAEPSEVYGTDIDDHLEL